MGIVQVALVVGAVLAVLLLALVVWAAWRRINGWRIQRWWDREIAAWNQRHSADDDCVGKYTDPADDMPMAGDLRDLPADIDWPPQVTASPLVANDRILVVASTEGDPWFEDELLAGNDPDEWSDPRTAALLDEWFAKRES